MSRWFFTFLAVLFSISPAFTTRATYADQPAPRKWMPAAIGVTETGTEIPVWLSAHAGQLSSPGNRILVIGGHDNSRASTDFVQKLLERAKLAKPGVQHSDVSFIPDVFPDGLAADLALIAGGKYPPPGKGFYDDKVLPEQCYLWRWVAMYGATVVIDVRAGGEPGHWSSEQVNSDQLAKQLEGTPLAKKLAAPQADNFVRHIAEKGIEDVGLVPTLLIKITPGPVTTELEAIEKILSSPPPTKSPVLKELNRREARTPQGVATDLVSVYGRELKQVAYIPSLAVIGRLKTLEATSDATEKTSLQNLLTPFLKRDVNPVPKSGSEHAGHLLFAELAKRSEGKDRERWIELCRAAADQIFDKDGKPLKLMPSHNEMSDAVFMATPIICATGKLTGERKYFDAAVTHFRGMKKLCLREDGLYRHSPQDEAAWGRGNGFPALGLAWALSEFPEDHPDFPELKKDFQNHIAALLKHQDEFGCWHQVIDKPGSYREFSATCMIGWALKRGIDRGWLDKDTHQKALDRAWIAAKQRIGPKGVVVDICTGTGKQKSLRDYYDRPAIWGVDARGGAMALMLATEMMLDEK